jgi:hypothetical protein
MASPRGSGWAGAYATAPESSTGEATIAFALKPSTPALCMHRSGAFVQLARALDVAPRIRAATMRWPAACSSVPPSRREVHMNDLLFVAITAAFFACSWAYVHACERLG